MDYKGGEASSSKLTEVHSAPVFQEGEAGQAETPADLERGSSSQGGVETGHLANDLPRSYIQQHSSTSWMLAIELHFCWTEFMCLHRAMCLYVHIVYTRMSRYLYIFIEPYAYMSIYSIFIYPAICISRYPYIQGATGETQSLKTR